MRTLVIAMSLVSLLMATACATKPAPQPNVESPVGRVVLLADPDGKVGAVTVRARDGSSIRLDKKLSAVSINRDLQLSDPFAMSLKQVESDFGPVLRVMPQPPQRFLLYFKIKTSSLTPESAKLLSDIEQTIKERDSKDISIIGHTDRVGDHDYNMVVSQRRAEKVAIMLQDRGISSQYMETSSHGENNPLIPTGDGKAHPKNRRVEVIIR